jgi:hypothetical protein
VKELTQTSINFDQALDTMQRDAHGPRLGQIFSGAPLTGDDLKEEGMSKALRKKASQQYRLDVVAALRCFPIRSRITVDRLTGIAGRPPAEVNPNAVGAIIASLAKQGMIRKTGRMVKSERKERHSGEAAEWEICSFEPIKHTKVNN